jgi:hypothetical protein
MAKQSVKEVVINTHKLSAEGTIEIIGDNIILSTTDLGDVPLIDLLKNFNAEFVSISVTNKSEEE